MRTDKTGQKVSGELDRIPEQVRLGRRRAEAVGKWMVRGAEAIVIATGARLAVTALLHSTSPDAVTADAFVFASAVLFWIGCLLWVTVRRGVLVAFDIGAALDTLDKDLTDAGPE